MFQNLSEHAREHEKMIAGGTLLWPDTPTTDADRLNFTAGIELHTFPNGTADLFSSTVGAGATISSPTGGGIKIVQASGAATNTTLNFDVPAFQLESDSTICVIYSINNPILQRSGSVYGTTQALNFSSFCAASSGAAFYQGVQSDGGDVLVNVTAASLDAGKSGVGATIGDTLDRMRLVFNLSQGAEIVIKRVLLSPKIKPTFGVYFDDGLISEYAEGFQYMAKKGLRGTLAVITNTVGGSGRITKSQLLEMQDAGWDIVNHTHTHVGANSGYGASPDQIALSQSVLAGDNFILNGSIGGALFDEPRCLIAISAGDETNKRLEVTGMDEHDNVITVTQNGIGTATFPVGQTVWKRIDQVKSIDGTTSTVKLTVSASHSELLYQIGTAQQWLRSNGFARTAHLFVAPGGQYNILTFRVLAELGITGMRTVQQYVEQPFIRPNPLTICSWGGGISSGGSATTIGYKDKAINQNAYTSVFLHDIIVDSGSPVAGVESRRSDFRLFIDAVAASVKANDVQCITMSEYFKLCGY